MLFRRLVCAAALAGVPVAASAVPAGAVADGGLEEVVDEAETVAGVLAGLPPPLERLLRRAVGRELGPDALRLLDGPRPGLGADVRPHREQGQRDARDQDDRGEHRKPDEQARREPSAARKLRSMLQP